MINMVLSKREREIRFITSLAESELVNSLGLFYNEDTAERYCEHAIGIVVTNE
jgi:hypothetical protein